jgi:hypothetical protein
MVPALGMPSPDAAASPGPRRRGERRWGCNASASPGTGSVGRPGSFRPHRVGGRRRSGAVANRGLDLGRRCHPRAGRRAHAIQDFKISARSSHRPISLVQDGMIILKSFMITERIEELLLARIWTGYYPVTAKLPGTVIRGVHDSLNMKHNISDIKAQKNRTNEWLYEYFHHN